MATVDSTVTRGTTRFSLRTLLLLIPVIAAPLAVCRWNMLVDVSLAVFVAGVIFTVFGVRARLHGATLAGVLLAIGSIVYVGWSSLTVVAWQGSIKLDVYVVVVDASSLTPVPDATVEVLLGPNSPIEYPPTPNVMNDFEVIELIDGTTSLKTDQNGRTTFSNRFRASGTKGLFSDIGSVRTDDLWLRVSAPGYTTTYMPIDQQSYHSRDLHDKRPIHVSVPIGKR